MPGRLIGFLLLVGSILLAIQLRGNYVVNPSPAAALRFAAFLGGVIVVAAVIGGGLFWKRRRLPALPPLGDNRRETFRIPYPEEERPLFFPHPGEDGTEEAAGHEVVDVSEEGLRYLDPAPHTVGEEIRGRLEFPSGSRAEIAGELVRTGNGEVCVHLRRVVPPRIIVDEQRRLRGHLKERVS